MSPKPTVMSPKPTMMSSCHQNPQWCHHVTQTHNDVIMSPKPTMMSSCHQNPQWCHHVTKTHSHPSCCSSWAVCCRSFTLPTHAVWDAFLFSSLQAKRCMTSPETTVIFHIMVPGLRSLYVPSPYAPYQMSSKMSSFTNVIFHMIVLDLQSLWCLRLLHLATLPNVT